LEVSTKLVEDGSVDIRAMLIDDATCKHGPEFWDVEKARIYKLCDGIPSHEELKP